MGSVQLDIFAPTKRPDKVGRSVVTYVDSKSVLQPASGFMGAYNFTLNPYGGCTFACDYCYARFFAPTEQLRDSWGEWIRVKESAVEVIRKAKKSKSKDHALHPGARIYMSSVTDPYQPIEKQIELTRRILEELIDVQPRLTIQTRSPIAVRDIDLFKQFKRIRVNMTISTDNEETRLRYEPHCPSVEVRLGALQEIADAGVPVGVSVSPMLPMRDAAAFGTRIAQLNAAEYVTQYLKPQRSRFSAGSTLAAIEKMREDGWDEASYARACAAIQDSLGPGRKLLEGAAGYAPA